MQTVKNITNGVRYINTKGGPIGLSPGEVSEPVDVSAEEMAVARETGWFEFDGDPAPAPDAAPKSDPNPSLIPVDAAFDPETVIAGNAPDVIASLASLTPEQRGAVRAAEVDREKPRKGVLEVIDELNKPAE